MIQQETRMKVADNTGAREILVIHVLGGSMRRYVMLAMWWWLPLNRLLRKGTVKKSEIVKAVIVRTAKEWRREDGSSIRFDDNAAVILDADGQNPRGTRIFARWHASCVKKGL